jgi:hypothetical protein
MRYPRTPTALAEIIRSGRRNGGAPAMLAAVDAPPTHALLRQVIRRYIHLYNINVWLQTIPGNKKSVDVYVESFGCGTIPATIRTMEDEMDDLVPESRSHEQ